MDRELRTQEINVPNGDIALPGTLTLPRDSRGVVLFAHGSGSNRFSPRNERVAGELQQAGFATLLMDLLTPEEALRDERTRNLRFDIGLLGQRVIAALDWMLQQPKLARMQIGLYGASTGAAAALVAAAEHSETVRAVVSRGGRPDLAGEALWRVEAPTVLIVGGNDAQVISLNEEALSKLRTEKKLEIVPGATHLFPEPGAMDQVCRLSVEWFQRHLERDGNSA